MATKSRPPTFGKTGKSRLGSYCRALGI